MNYITFDIETYSPTGSDRIDTKEMRASVVGAYISWIDTYIAFLEQDIPDFITLLTQAELVVGYNHIWFDLPVLQKYTTVDLLTLPSYDIMIEVEKKIGFKLKLNELCKANLGTQKTDTYEQFKHYYTDKNWFPLIDYCMHDVRLTEELFQLIITKGVLVYKDLLETREVSPDKPVPGKQALVNNTEEQRSESIF